MTAQAVVVELVLPYPPRALSPNARPNRWDKAEAVKQYRFDCKMLGRSYRNKHGLPPYPLALPVTAQVTFVVTTTRNRDEDNLGASIKALWDGLCDAYVLATDDAGSLHILPPIIIKGPRAEVRVTLTGATR